MERVYHDATNEIVANENDAKTEETPKPRNLSEELEDLPISPDFNPEKAEGMNEADNL
jgi:hypothetical protein